MVIQHSGQYLILNITFQKFIYGFSAQRTLQQIIHLTPLFTVSRGSHARSHLLIKSDKHSHKYSQGKVDIVLYMLYCTLPTVTFDMQTAGV